jgi:CRP-like cAMP-binding protein
MDRAEIRRRLRRSSLLDQLGEDDLARLAVATQPVRFARGEVIVDADAVNRDLYVLWDGKARMVVDDADGSQRSIAEFSGGDVFGLLSRSDEWDETPRVVAITDCEVLIIGADAAGGAASRNPALAGALNQLMVTRRRRVERMLRERFSTVSPSEAQPAIPTDASDEIGGGRS